MAKLRSERYEYIKEAVVNTLVECDIKNVPIDPFEICRRRNYKLIKYTDKYDIDDLKKVVDVYPNGFKQYLNDEMIIEYNDLMSEERIRTTIFHEIGHIELRHVCECELSETEAEWFGVYMIAPAPLVGLYKIEDYKDLSDVFYTSLECGKNSFQRYINWKEKPGFLKEYEERLINQFTK